MKHDNEPSGFTQTENFVTNLMTISFYMELEKKAKTITAQDSDNKLATHPVLNKHQQNVLNVLFRTAVKIEFRCSRVFTITHTKYSQW